MANSSNFIDALFQNMLGRQADAPGALFWQNQNMTPGQMTDAVRASPEYRDNPDFNRTQLGPDGKPLPQGDMSSFITSLYNDKLNRKPDQAGLNYWMQSGLNPTDLTTQFNKSNENRAGPGIDWANLTNQSHAYTQGMSNSPFVMNFQNVPSDKQAAFNMFYDPKQQAGGVAPIRGPNNVNVGPQASDNGVYGLLQSAVNGNSGQDWPSMIAALQKSNPDVAGILAGLLKPTSDGSSASPTDASSGSASNAFDPAAWNRSVG